MPPRMLQDIHWSMGGLGLFPTYTLGKSVRAHSWSSPQDLPDLDDDFRRGEFGRLEELAQRQDSPSGYALSAG